MADLGRTGTPPQTAHLPGLPNRPKARGEKTRYFNLQTHILQE